MFNNVVPGLPGEANMITFTVPNPTQTPKGVSRPRRLFQTRRLFQSPDPAFNRRFTVHYCTVRYFFSFVLARDKPGS